VTRGSFRAFPSALPGIDAMASETAHVFPRHTHEQFGIGIIYRGAQRSLSGRGVVEAGPGDVITVNPGEVHDGMPIGGAGRAWRILYLSPTLVAQAAEDIGDGHLRRYEFPHPALSDKRLARRVDGLFAAITDEGGVGCEERLLTLLADALHERGLPMPARPTPDRIKPAQDMIDGDPAMPVSLADLAAACGLSRFQLVRAFARVTGLTPHAYLVQRRVALARRLIARHTPLAEAAVEAGFADQSHMSRVFARTYGLSPGVYAAATR
jgi:AraC-like DNA-binding protein